MTCPDPYDYIQTIVVEDLRTYPYLLLVDQYKTIEKSLLAGIGAKVVGYEDDRDYARIRMESELAKRFELERTVFLFQNKAWGERFGDLETWLKRVDVDTRLLEYFARMLGVEVPEPLAPLVALVTKRKLIERSVDFWQRASPTEPSVDFLADFLLSVLLNECIFETQGGDDRITRLFTVVWDMSKYEQARCLLIEEESREFVERAFSTAELMRKSLQDADLRMRLCRAMLGLYCSSRFPVKRRQVLSPLLFERLGIQSEAEREEFLGFFEIVKAHFPALVRGALEEDVIKPVNDFVEINKTLWFQPVQNVSDLEHHIKESPGILIAEVNQVCRAVMELIEGELVGSVLEAQELSRIFNITGSWPVAKLEECRKELDNLKQLTGLLVLGLELRNQHPASWSEWVSTYENCLLPGDALFRSVMRSPDFSRRPASRRVIDVYSKAQSRAVAMYEAFLMNSYPEWVSGSLDRPKMVTDITSEVSRLLKDYDVVLLLVYDGMRLDFWKILQNELERDFSILSQQAILAVIPSTTEYSRRAIFSGLFPSDHWTRSETKMLEARFQPCKYKAGRNIQTFKELLSGSERVKVWVYRLVDEIGHSIQEGLDVALAAFEQIASEHVKLLAQVKKLGKVALLVTSDHGQTEVEGGKNIKVPDMQFGTFKFSPHQRYAIFAREPLKHLSNVGLGTLVDSIEKQNLGYLITRPEKLKLEKVWVRSVRWVKSAMIQPYFIVIARGKFYFPDPYQGPPGREQQTPKFAHGGLTPYETIIPLAILTPK